MAKYLVGAVKGTANVASNSKIATGAIYGALRVGQSARLLTGFALGTSENILKTVLSEEKYNGYLEAAECGENAAWHYLLQVIPIKEDTKLAVDCIRNIAKALKIRKMTVKMLFKRRKPLTILVLLMNRAHELLVQNTSIDFPYKPIQLSNEEIDEMQRLAKFSFDLKFAIDEVNDGNDEKAFELLGLTDEDEILDKKDEDFNDKQIKGYELIRIPMYLIFTDVKSKSIVMSFRGTQE